MAGATPAEQLLASARALIPLAVAPYSGFRVGVALEDATGIVHPGVNAESASLGLTQCAERNALFGALARGARQFRRMAIAASQGPKPVLPCGACRQVLYEYAPELSVIVEHEEGRVEEIPLRDLLPRAFTRFDPAG